jgi:hypothetical protein
MEKLFNLLKKNPLQVLILVVFLAFSAFLMLKTFGVEGGNIKIATKAWSDFAATLPLIRSFSLGDNFPPEYPIFAGYPIRYHFVFFLVVGILEKLGLPLDWALNGLSVASFFALTAAIYFLAKEVFRKKSVAVLSVILFAFNGSLSFLEFFKTHPLSLSTLKEIVGNPTFSSFGPYDGKIVSAFWSLNIFTNQRHLALAYAAFLGLVLIIYKASEHPKGLTITRTILLGILVGLFPFIHTAVFGMMGLALIIFFFIYPTLRSNIFTIGAIAFTLALPQILYMGASQVEFSYLNPGYLISNPTLKNFLTYWVFNLGLATILAPLGFLISRRGQRKILLPFLVLFVVGNIFQFTPDLPTNHKFFNLFLIGANVFVAYFLVRLWKKSLLSKLIVPIFIFFLTLSGIIDFFPIINDGYQEIQDIPQNRAAAFIQGSTPKDSVFLNANFLYDPASLAGRKVYLGWPYFSWGAGYDTTARHALMKEMLDPKGNLQEECLLLQREEIDYIEVKNPTDLSETSINYDFFERNFPRAFYEPSTNVTIYSVSPTCG